MFSGLFRLPGAVTKINIICAALDSPNYKGDIIDDFELDNHALASILKKFFRDLEIPVLSKLKENGDIDVIGTDNEITGINFVYFNGYPENYNQGSILTAILLSVI